MINYDDLVNANNILKTNPFINHITITRVANGYVYFDGGCRYCNLEQLEAAIYNGSGYATNISLVKQAVDRYNTKLEKKEKHSILQQAIRDNMTKQQENARMTLIQRLERDRIENGIKEKE